MSKQSVISETAQQTTAVRSIYVWSGDVRRLCVSNTNTTAAADNSQKSKSKAGTLPN